ncbi:MAG: flagellar biosynthesis protein FlhA, partial [Pseudomonadota bacterium]
MTGFAARLTQARDLSVGLLLFVVVMLMILPMPTILVDVLIGLNFGVAVLLLMTGIYIATPLSISSLPAIILVSTIFRLALSITTTRLILAEADAGAIVETFGTVVVAGNIVVGMVVFFIITIVQFIVIAKGSERIAEVGARFTLDALPGKQMAIDAELRNGDIDAEEASRRRGLLERESQFYGAMDGAMKFVKGDTVAGLVIIFVNLLGGLTVGILQRGMPLGEAATVYSLLTVGDALISQIPALLMAITAAIIVTRVKGNENRNLGSDIASQVFADTRALRLAGAALILMG